MGRHINNPDTTLSVEVRLCKLSVLGRRMFVICGQALWYGSLMGTVVSDGAGNIHVLGWDPLAPGHKKASQVL